MAASDLIGLSVGVGLLVAIFIASLWAGHHIGKRR